METKKEKKEREIRNFFLKQQAAEVKRLGERIGYGNMMAMASALWRKSLTEQGFPTDGAHVPTLKSFIKKGLHDPKEDQIYDEIVRL